MVALDALAAFFSLETTSFAACLEAFPALDLAGLGTARSCGIVEDDGASAYNWVAIIRKYLDLSELDRSTIDELIDHIEIGERSIVDGQRKQAIKVFYRFIGQPDPGQGINATAQLTHVLLGQSQGFLGLVDMEHDIFSVLGCPDALGTVQSQVEGVLADNTDGGHASTQQVISELESILVLDNLVTVRHDTQGGVIGAAEIDLAAGDQGVILGVDILLLHRPVKTSVHQRIGRGEGLLDSHPHRKPSTPSMCQGHR